MAFAMLMVKARKITLLKDDLMVEKMNCVKVHEGQKTKYSLWYKCTHCIFKIKKCAKKCCKIFTFPKNTCLYKTLVKFRREGTFENYLLKSAGGFILGFFLTYLFFLFFVIVLGFKLFSATLMCMIFGCILTIGMAFSQNVRCIVFLMLPQFFTKRGRQALLAYAFVLALTGPAKNTVNNMGIMSESLACGQEQLKQAVKQILEVIKKPFIAIKEAIKKVIKVVKVIIQKIKEIFLMIKKIVMCIVRVIKAAFSFLGKIFNICSKKVGTPFERCIRVFDNAVTDCHAKLGPLFSWLCSIAYVTQAVCYIVKPLDFICMLIDFISNSIIGVIIRKIKTFIRHIRTMFYVRIRFSHSFEFQTTSSKSLKQIAADILAEIKQRTTVLVAAFNLLAFATSFFFLVIVLRAMYYRYKFLTQERFDNRFITRNFREIDFKRAQMDRETVLPLNHRERVKYVDASSIRLVDTEKKNLSKSIAVIMAATYKLATYIFMDYSLYWILATIRYHGRYKSTIQAPKVVGLHIEGRGFLADLYRSIVKAFQPLGVKMDVDTVPCLPDPIPPNIDRYIQIAFIVLLCWILAIFEPYGLRMRHSVMCSYYPARARERAVWLYNHIIRNRNSFLKFARRQLRRKFFGTESISKVTCKEYLRAKIGTNKYIRFLLCLGDDKQDACLLCGEVFREDDPVKPIRCPKPGCPGIYCERCYSDLNNLCTICLEPIQYGDLSDVEEEKDSSEDETSTKFKRRSLVKEQKKKDEAKPIMKPDNKEDFDDGDDSDEGINIQPQEPDDEESGGTQETPRKQEKTPPVRKLESHPDDKSKSGETTEDTDVFGDDSDNINEDDDSTESKSLPRVKERAADVTKLNTDTGEETDKKEKDDVDSDEPKTPPRVMGSINLLEDIYPIVPERQQVDRKPKLEQLKKQADKTIYGNNDSDADDEDDEYDKDKVARKQQRRKERTKPKIKPDDGKKRDDHGYDKRVDDSDDDEDDDYNAEERGAIEISQEKNSNKPVIKQKNYPDDDKSGSDKTEETDVFGDDSDNIKDTNDTDSTVSKSLPLAKPRKLEETKPKTTQQIQNAKEMPKKQEEEQAMTEKSCDDDKSGTDKTEESDVFGDDSDNIEETDDDSVESKPLPSIPEKKQVGKANITKKKDETIETQYEGHDNSQDKADKKIIKEQPRKRKLTKSKQKTDIKNLDESSDNNDYDQNDESWPLFKGLLRSESTRSRGGCDISDSDYDSEYSYSGNSTDYSFSYQYDKDFKTVQIPLRDFFIDVEMQRIPDYTSMEVYGDSSSLYTREEPVFSTTTTKISAGEQDEEDNANNNWGIRRVWQIFRGKSYTTLVTSDSEESTYETVTKRNIPEFESSKCDPTPSTADTQESSGIWNGIRRFWQILRRTPTKIYTLVDSDSEQDVSSTRIGKTTRKLKLGNQSYVMLPKLSDTSESDSEEIVFKRNFARSQTDSSVKTASHISFKKVKNIFQTTRKADEEVVPLLNLGSVGSTSDDYDDQATTFSDTQKGSSYSRRNSSKFNESTDDDSSTEKSKSASTNQGNSSTQKSKSPSLSSSETPSAFSISEKSDVIQNISINLLFRNVKYEEVNETPRKNSCFYFCDHDKPYSDRLSYRSSEDRTSQRPPRQLLSGVASISSEQFQDRSGRYQERARSYYKEISKKPVASSNETKSTSSIFTLIISWFKN